jgi:hypothetical protein
LEASALEADAGDKPVKKKRDWRRMKQVKTVRFLTLDDLDRRTSASRYAVGLRDGLISDMGGDDVATNGQRELAQRAATLGAMCEDREAKWLKGEPVELAEYCTMVNAQRRVLADIGLERRAKNVTPDLSQYLVHVKANKPEASGDE